jgi:hypothetical protein
MVMMEIGIAEAEWEIGIGDSVANVNPRRNYSGGI